MSGTADFAEIDAWAETSFAKHQLTARESSSFRVGGPGTNVDAFTVTWCPGHLFLGGDLGELAVTHYHALRTFDGAVGWLRGASFEYLMEKTAERRVYDPEATAATFVFWANEEAREVLSEARAAHDPGALRPLGARRPDYPMWRTLRDFTSAGVSFRRGAGRRAVAARLADFLREGQHQAADLSHRLGCDDYYGSDSYTVRHRWQWRALRLWAEMMAAESAEPQVAAP